MSDVTGFASQLSAHVSGLRWRCRHVPMFGSLGGYRPYPERPRHLPTRSLQRPETALAPRLPTLSESSATLRHLFNMSQSVGSSSKSSTTTASSSNLKVILEKALDAYKIKIKQDLITHPLASQLQACDSSAAILTILQDHIQQFERSRGSDERLRRWLNPTINVLYAFSATLGQGVGLVHIN